MDRKPKQDSHRKSGVGGTYAYDATRTATTTLLRETREAGRTEHMFGGGRGKGNYGKGVLELVARSSDALLLCH